MFCFFLVLGVMFVNLLKITHLKCNLIFFWSVIVLTIITINRIDILNIANMNKKYIELAKQKLQNHKVNGSKTELSIFQVAELIDVINGKIEKFTLNNLTQNLSISLN